MKRAPLFFVGHGSPMFALDKSVAAQNLAAQSHLLDDVDAILVISPHWMTRGSRVATADFPKTVYDFGGFSPELYQLEYSASGSNELGHRLVTLLDQNGFQAAPDIKRGWDHGLWVPLLHLRPTADKPVVQLSMDMSLSVDELEKLGQVLKQIREQNIAIICSGSLTHNLREIRMDDSSAADYANRFQAWVREMVTAGNLEAIKRAKAELEDYSRAHPTDEHFLPLVIALAVADEREEVEVLASPILHYTISMESYVWSGSN